MEPDGTCDVNTASILNALCPFRQTLTLLPVRATEEGGGRLSAEGGGESKPGAGADGSEGELKEGPERRSHPRPHH